MRKTFFLLPLVAGVLAACHSSNPAPVVNAGELSPGIMQPVMGSGAMDNSYGWQTDVQNTPMPSTMTQPSYTPQPLPQPTYQPAPQPVAFPPPAPEPVVQPAPAKPAPAPQPKAAAKPKQPVSQDFTIPRDAKNAPIYSQIDKGFYNGDTYTVRKGDTMFLIAYIAGKDVRELAKLNNMSEPYQLNVGQTLRLNPVQTQQASTSATTAPKTAPVAPPKPVEPEVTYTQAPNGTAYGSDGTVTGPVKAGVGVTPPAPRPVITATAGSPGSVRATTANQAPVPSTISWQWPTQGRIVAGFSNAENGNKGLDIAGNKGQPVKAAAAGKVVYAGDTLRGYGNMIIIRHNDDFLSAYAHNDSLKVQEQDNVKAGQTIATLGSSGTNSNKLHFEIRYQGKSVDPMRYLPRR